MVQYQGVESTVDVIVVGAGHNGLAAAIILAAAGREVLVLERNKEPGGAVRTGEVTLPGFRHDLFATNLNLFAGSPFFREFGARLEEHGLEFVPSAKPFCSVFPDGRMVGVSTDLDQTRSSIQKASPRDAESWTRLHCDFEVCAPHLFPLLECPMPSWRLVRLLWRGCRELGRQWPVDLLKLVLQSPREFVEAHFESPHVQALCASWGMHLDFPPDMAGGALFPYLESMASQTHGMVLGKGGAETMIQAMVRLLQALGGRLETDASVRSIQLSDGRAVGVRTTDGRQWAARKVIANLAPTVLLDLLPQESIGDALRTKVGRFRYGPGTMMIHLALEDLPRWRAGEEARQFCYVHVGPFLDDMSLAYQQALAGLLPQRPTLVVGQPTTVDPSRAPAGKHILWIQVRLLPARIVGDAAEEITGTQWASVKEAYADRVLSQLESLAPGLKSQISDRAVLSPSDLQAANPNLVGGDNLGGSHHLMQNFIFRPFFGWSRYRTPFKNLYLCGASTWPGAGVGAGSGTLLARSLIG